LKHLADSVWQVKSQTYVHSSTNFFCLVALELLSQFCLVVELSSDAFWPLLPLGVCHVSQHMQVMCHVLVVLHQSAFVCAFVIVISVISCKLYKLIKLQRFYLIVDVSAATAAFFMMTV